MRTSRFLWTALLSAVAAATAGQAMAENAIQLREDRANHDRWARSEAQANAKAKHKDRGAEDAESVPVESDSPRHHGELNGKLHLSGW